MKHLIQLSHSIVTYLTATLMARSYTELWLNTGPLQQRSLWRIYA